MIIIKKFLSIVLIVVTALVLLCSCGLKAKNGFVDEGEGRIYYYVNGEKQIGWQKINNEWYYFYETDYYEGEYKGKGSMKYRTWLQKDGEYYFFNGDGKMLRDGLWKLDDGNLYYFDSNGKMLHDTEKMVKGSKFIFDSNGIGKEAPYYSAPAMMGSMYNFYLKDNLPKKIYPGVGGDQYGYWIIEDNISLKVVGQTLYINGIIESQIRDRSAHSLGCRLSLTDKNGVTTTIGDRIYPDVVDKGQRTYIEFKVPGLPIIGGDIYIDFYH